MRSLRMAERESVPAGGGSSLPFPGVSGINPPALRPAREVHRWKCGTMPAGSPAQWHPSHEACPEVSLWDE